MCLYVCLYVCVCVCVYMDITCWTVGISHCVQLCPPNIEVRISEHLNNPVRL